jgi:DNA-binding MarR family transcriptional regulator
MGAHTTSLASLTIGENRDISRAMNAVRGIVRALRINTRAIELKMGISLAQLFVLQQLAEKAAESLNELADRTATHQSSVSVVVRRLVDNGLVSRAEVPNDRRRIRIELTAAGHQKLAGAPSTVQVELIAGLQRLDTEQRRTLADLLELWTKAAGVDLATPPMMGEDEPEDR